MFLFTSEFGLPDPDDHVIDELDYIHYPRRRREILVSIIIISITCFILFSLTTFFLFSFSEKQPSSLRIKDNINSTFVKGHTKIKAGQNFSDSADGLFDDSLMENFTSSHYLSGIIIRFSSQCVGWFQCFYTSSNHPENIIQGPIYGIRDTTDVGDPFFLEKDERISKVQVKADYVQLYLNGVPSMKPKLIIAIRFFTTKGRSSPTIDSFRGKTFTEEFEGYTLGYLTGSYSRYINHLQFYWYQTINN